MTEQTAERAICVGRHDQPRAARKAHLCDSCRDKLYTLLVALPDLARMVRENTEGLHGQSGEGRVSGSRERPLPNGTLLSLLGPAAGDHLTEHAHPADQDGIVPIPDVLVGWVRMCCEERLLTAPSSTLKSICAFLREHLDWFADQPFADEFDTEIRDCHSRLLGAAGLGSSRTRYRDAECPECSAVGSLIRWDGQDEIRCHSTLGGCGTAMSAYMVTAMRAKGDVA